MDGPMPIGAIQGDAVAKMLREGPTRSYRRVEEAILEDCPEFAASWGLGYVAGLVAEGLLPESAVAKALGNYRRRIRLGAAGELDPIRAPASYLAVVFRDELSRHGLPWRKPERRRKQA